MTFTTEKALREYLASPDAILNCYLAAMFPPYDVDAPEKVSGKRDEVIEFLYTLPENADCFAALVQRTIGKPLDSDPNDSYTPTLDTQETWPDNFSGY
jgi:hypothetical protein